MAPTSAGEPAGVDIAQDVVYTPEDLHTLQQLFSNPLFDIASFVSTYATGPPTSTPAQAQQTRYGRISRPPGAGSALQAVAGDRQRVSSAAEVPNGAAPGRVGVGAPPPVRAPSPSSLPAPASKATPVLSTLTPNVPSPADSTTSPLPGENVPARRRRGPGRPKEGVPKEEAVRLRRERNKMSAIASRRRKREEQANTAEELKIRTAECDELWNRVQDLESYVARLQHTLRVHRIAVPSPEDDISPLHDEPQGGMPHGPHNGPAVSNDTSHAATPVQNVHAPPPMGSALGPPPQPQQPEPPSFPTPTAMLPLAGQPTANGTPLPALPPGNLPFSHPSPLDILAAAGLNTQLATALPADLPAAIASLTTPGSFVPPAFSPAQSTNPNTPAVASHPTPLAQLMPATAPNASNTFFGFDPFTGGDGYDTMSLSALFNFDELDGDENDADFVPTSPKRDSSDDESDFEFEADEAVAERGKKRGRDDDDEDGEEASKRRRAKRPDRDREEADAQGDRARTHVNTDVGDDGDDERDEEDRDDADDADFVADDEEEDLFLPIEDVPIPVDQLYQDAMDALGVRSRDELADVISKLVDAAGAGGHPELSEGLRRLMAITEGAGRKRPSGSGSGGEGAGAGGGGASGDAA